LCPGVATTLDNIEILNRLNRLTGNRFLLPQWRPRLWIKLAGGSKSYKDGVSNPSSSNFEITADQFDEAITHEIGHFSGLGHSQINS
jgi:hypothetical protein